MVMRHFKQVILLYGFLIVTITFIQSCTTASNENDNNSEINLNIVPPNEKQQNPAFDNVSLVSKKDYLNMTDEEKVAFKSEYLKAFRSGGGCSCSHSSGCDCSVTCPSGTKPKCQCSENGCDCGCEPYSIGALRLQYEVNKQEDGSILLKKLGDSKSLLKFSNSNLPNVKQIVQLFSEETTLKSIENNNIELSSEEFYMLESQFQKWMINYTIEQFFEVEYGF